MSTALSSSSAPSTTHFSLIRDIVVVVAVTVSAAVIAAHFELNEVVFSLTRRWEHLQLDEWPIALLVLALSLMWLAWRRYRQARVELRARVLAEERLAAALRDNRALGHEHVRALEAERKHLARELHDELGQYLNAIKLDAMATRDDADRRDDEAAQAAARILKAVDHVYAVVSELIRRLRPAGLDELGLVAAIEALVDHWRQRSPATSFALTADGSLDDLGEATNLTVYRMVQECLTNSSKHAAAGRIDVTLQRAAGELVVTVADDGRGFDQSAQRPGFGLRGMRERAAMLGGRLETRSTTGSGCVVVAHIPCSGEG